eukprot:SAG11_NODE_1306_length_5245_cov_6.023513_1_plen_139_part_00
MVARATVSATWCTIMQPRGPHLQPNYVKNNSATGSLHTQVQASPRCTGLPYISRKPCAMGAGLNGAEQFLLPSAVLAIQAWPGIRTQDQASNLSTTAESDLWGRLARKQGIIMQIFGCAIVRTLSRTMVVAATKSSGA